MSTRNQLTTQPRRCDASIDLWSIDPRSASLFRISLGLLLFVHAVCHLRLYADLYSPSGVIRSELLASSNAIPQFPSLLTWLERSDSGFSVFVATAAISYTAMTIGWNTRLATMSSLLAFSTICHRNPYLVIGSDELTGSMLLWACLLPTAAHFSVDARIGRRRKAIVGAADKSSRLAMFGTLMQLGIVYFATALQKSGPTWWSDGSALVRILGLTTYRLPGATILESLPMPVLAGLSRTVVSVEYAIPILILSPFGQPCLRRLAMVCIASLHIGIALTVNTGLFSLTMLAMIPLLLSRRDFERLAQIAGRVNVIADLCNELESIPRRVARRAWGLEIIAIYLLSGFAQQNWNMTFAPKDWRIPDSPITLPWRFAAAVQRWNMFAPDPPAYDAHITVQIIDRDGSSSTVWDSHSVTARHGDRQIDRTNFLWKVYMQKASLMLDKERRAEGAELRRAICRFFAENGFGLPKHLPGENSSSDPHSSVEQVELWVEWIPTVPMQPERPAIETACVARYTLTSTTNTPE